MLLASINWGKKKHVVPLERKELQILKINITKKTNLMFKRIDKYLIIFTKLSVQLLFYILDYVLLNLRL